MCAILLSPDMLFLAQNASQTVLQVDFALIQWGSLQHSNRPPIWTKGVGPQEGEGENRVQKEREKGRVRKKV